MPRHNSASRACVCLAAVVFAFALAQPAYAANITVNATCSISDALKSAQNDTATGGCTAGSGADTITLSLNATLTEDPPEFTTSITIEGAGYSISGDDKYAFFDVQPAASLTLNNLTLTKGKGGADYLIITRGDFTMTNSALVDSATDDGWALLSLAQRSGKQAIISNSTIVHDSNAVTAILLPTNVLGSVTLSHVTIINEKYPALWPGSKSTMEKINLRNSLLGGAGGGFALCQDSGGGTLKQNVGNLIRDNSCSPAAYGDPLLGSFTGSPGYYPIRSDSPAKDIGNATVCAAYPKDQAGKDRPATNCNAGSVEAEYAAPTATPTPTGTWSTPTPTGTWSTNTPTPTPTGTWSTDTPTPTPTPTGTWSTNTPTATPTPTGTWSTNTPTATPTPTGTWSTNTPTATPTPTGTWSTNTPTATPTPTGTWSTNTPTATPTPTGTWSTNTPTATPTPTGTWATNTPTATATLRQRQSRAETPPGRSRSTWTPTPNRRTDSTCNDFQGPRIRVSGHNPGTQCQRVYADGIGNAQALAGGYVYALDVWGYLGAGVQVCFDKPGKAILLDAAFAPRRIAPLHAYSERGQSCVDLQRAGTIVLQPGPWPPARATPAGEDLGWTLRACMARLNAVLNFRSSPGGSVKNVLRSGIKLTALRRTRNWIYVDYHGERGWVSAEWVKLLGGCK